MRGRQSAKGAGAGMQGPRSLPAAENVMLTHAWCPGSDVRSVAAHSGPTSEPKRTLVWWKL